MNNQNPTDDRDEVLFALHRACTDPTAEQIIEWVNRFPQFGDDIRAHAVILKDWAAREGLPMEEPDEVMLSRSRSRALDAVYNASITRGFDPSSASARSFGESHMAEPWTVSANAVATDGDRSISTPGSIGLFAVWSTRQFQRRCAVGLAILVLGLSYAPNFRDLLSIWISDPNYSHGFLVIPIALWILTQRLSGVPAKPSPTTVPAQWWGWVCAVRDFGFASLCVRAQLTVAGNRDPLARDCVSHLEFWQLATLAPGLASHRIPCLFVPSTAQRQ